MIARLKPGVMPSWEKPASGREVRAITTYKPGNIVPISGQYGVVDAFGIYLGVERTCVKGEPFPPITTSGGVGYVLRDATQH
jgi:hypothetical protein